MMVKVHSEKRNGEHDGFIPQSCCWAKLIIARERAS